MNVVSIHASVKDATFGASMAGSKPCVSIHASVKDATELHLKIARSTQVSIHASVKDATSFPPVCPQPI